MQRQKERALWIFSLAALLFSTCPASARVTRVEIISRSEIQDGRSFGLAGPYEKIVGRIHFAVDPANIHNRQIVDLDKAPRNAEGEVEFSADLYLLRPKDMDKGNGAVLFEVSNRGGKGILRIVDGGASPDPKDEYGDGFLLRQGYTVAWVGWEPDLADTGDRLRLPLPSNTIPEEKRSAAWCARISRPPKKWRTCLWGIFFSAPPEGKAIPSMIPPVPRIS